MDNFSKNNEPWSVLGLFPGATRSQVKSAYRQLAKRYHPDKHLNSKEFNEKFKSINIAYKQCLHLIDAGTKSAFASRGYTSQPYSSDGTTGEGGEEGERASFNKSNDSESNKSWSGTFADGFKKTAMDFKDGFGVLTFLQERQLHKSDIPVGARDGRTEIDDLKKFIFNFVGEMFVHCDSVLSALDISSAQSIRYFWNKFFVAIDFFQFHFGKSFFGQDVRCIFLYAMLGIKDIDFLNLSSSLFRGNDFLTMQEKDFLDFNSCLNVRVEGFELLAALCVQESELNKNVYKQENFYKHFCVLFHQFYNLENYCLLRNDYFYSKSPIALHLLKNNFFCFKVFFNEGLFDFNSKIYVKQRWFILKNSLSEFIIQNNVEDFDVCFDVLLFIEGLGWIRKLCDSSVFFDKKFAVYCKQRLTGYYIQQSDVFFLPRTSVAYKKRLDYIFLSKKYRNAGFNFLRFIDFNYLLDSLSVDKVLVNGSGNFFQKEDKRASKFENEVFNVKEQRPGEECESFSDEALKKQLARLPQKKEQVNNFINRRNKSIFTPSAKEEVLMQDQKSLNSKCVSDKEFGGPTKRIFDNNVIDSFNSGIDVHAQGLVGFERKNVNALKLLFLTIKGWHNDKKLLVHMVGNKYKGIDVKLLSVDGLPFEKVEICTVFESFWNTSSKKRFFFKKDEVSIFSFTENLLLTKKSHELIIRKLGFNSVVTHEGKQIEELLFLFLSIFEAKKYKHCFNLLNALGFIQSSFVLLSKINNMFVFEFVCYHFVERNAGARGSESFYVWMSLWYDAWLKSSLFSLDNNGRNFENEKEDGNCCSRDVIDLKEALLSPVVANCF